MVYRNVLVFQRPVAADVDLPEPSAEPEDAIPDLDAPDAIEEVETATMEDTDAESAASDPDGERKSVDL